MVKSSPYSTNCTVKSSELSTIFQYPHSLGDSDVTSLMDKNSSLSTSFTLKSAPYSITRTLPYIFLPLNVQCFDRFWWSLRFILSITDGVFSDGTGDAVMTVSGNAFKLMYLKSNTPVCFITTGWCPSTIKLVKLKNEESLPCGNGNRVLKSQITMVESGKRYFPAVYKRYNRVGVPFGKVSSTNSNWLSFAQSKPALLKNKLTCENIVKDKGSKYREIIFFSWCKYKKNGKTNIENKILQCG